MLTESASARLATPMFLHPDQLRGGPRNLPEYAAQTVTGSAGDFCRLVTQRVHRADTDLVATGDDVDRWLDIAQAFAGQPGEGRAPR